MSHSPSKPDSGATPYDVTHPGFGHIGAIDSTVETLISIVCEEVGGERRMLIEDQQFQLRNGNLFYVFLDKEMKFDRAEQLSETITRKATIADLKRLAPENAAVQAITVFDSEDRYDNIET